MPELTYINITNPTLTLSIVIWSLYVGLVIACALAVREKRRSSAIVASLLSAGADSPDRAMTLAEAGLKPNKSLLGSLKEGRVLRRYVLCANEGEFRRSTDKTKLTYKLARFLSVSRDYSERLTEGARFYIPEENRITAELRFKERKHGWRSVVGYAILLAAAMLFASFAIPRLAALADSAIAYLASL